MRSRLPLRAGSLPALALIVLLVILLAGCGGSSSSSGNGVESKSATEIVAASKAAADAASSVHVSGSIVSGSSPITLDMDLVAGKGGKGKLSENGISFELIQVDGTAYIKGSPAFYRQLGGKAAVQLFEGKWLKAPTASGDFAALASLTELRKLIDTTLASHGTLKKGASTTIDGQGAISVTDAAQGGTLYVATTGKPFPLQLAKGGTGGGKVSFERWDEPVTLTAPANAVDITQLQHAASGK